MDIKLHKNDLPKDLEFGNKIAIDCEFMGLNFLRDKLCLVQISSGKNDAQEKIAMTTPVTQVEKNGNITMQFYLPSKFNSDNVPNPSREDVRIVNIEGGYYAVLRYSGRASDGNFIKHKEILEKELNKNKISIISPPIRATYDSPFTLPMNRRNEAMYKVEFNS